MQSYNIEETVAIRIL